MLYIHSVVFNYLYLNVEFLLLFSYCFLYFFYKLCFMVINTTYINIEFFTLTVTTLEGLWFKPLQESIFMLNNDIALIFFRIYNNTNTNIHLLTTYTIFPFFYSIFLNKIQCFCFDTILLKKYCSIDLPVLFTLQIPYELLNKTAIKISLVYSIFIL